jgi:hypothetical protein
MEAEAKASLEPALTNRSNTLPTEAALLLRLIELFQDGGERGIRTLDRAFDPITV